MKRNLTTLPFENIRIYIYIYILGEGLQSDSKWPWAWVSQARAGLGPNSILKSSPMSDKLLLFKTELFKTTSPEMFCTFDSILTSFWDEEIMPQEFKDARMVSIFSQKLRLTIRLTTIEASHFCQLLARMILNRLNNLTICNFVKLSMDLNLAQAVSAWSSQAGISRNNASSSIWISMDHSCKATESSQIWSAFFTIWW